MEAIDLSPLAHGNSGQDWQEAHDAIKADDRLWRRCAFDGVQGDGKMVLYENRRCPACESTLSRPINMTAAFEAILEIEQRLQSSREQWGCAALEVLMSHCGSSRRLKPSKGG